MARRISAPRRIWLAALGYFAAYVPYAFLTKALSDGLLPDVRAIDGVGILPITTGVSALAALAYLGGSGLWRRAATVDVGGRSFPRPRLVTAISGVCTSLVIVTTTLSYAFRETSIVTMMLLMRGGVLALAPLVDRLSGRSVRWYSWAALVLSALGVIAGVGGLGDASGLSAEAAADVAVYLGAYLVRLRAMSRHAKRDVGANTTFFVEEQLVAAPFAALALATAAALGGALTEPLRAGTTAALSSAPTLLVLVVIGLCSQGTGVFGAWVLLDPAENTFSVPVNRAASVVAGWLASLALAAWLGGRPPHTSELFGAALLLAAIVVLAIGPVLDARCAVPSSASP
jgi:drug/metabolite transporter (DMT)-like permease